MPQVLYGIQVGAVGGPGENGVDVVLGQPVFGGKCGVRRCVILQQLPVGLLHKLPVGWSYELCVQDLLVGGSVQLEALSHTVEGNDSTSTESAPNHEGGRMALGR